MHPAWVDFSASFVADALRGMPTKMLWAKDDPKAPAWVARHYVKAGADLKLLDKGGHANFDGGGGLLNFDDDIVEWFTSR